MVDHIVVGASGLTTTRTHIHSISRTVASLSLARNLGRIMVEPLENHYSPPTSATPPLIEKETDNAMYTHWFVCMGSCMLVYLFLFLLLCVTPGRFPLHHLERLAVFLLPSLFDAGSGMGFSLE